MNYSKKRTDFFNKQFSYKKNKNPLYMTKGSQEEFNAFLNASGIKKGMNIIELGCGDGRYVLPLLQYGCSVMGVDIAREALESLKKRAKKFHLEKKVRTLYSDFSKVPPSIKNKFDLGYIISTLHLLSNNRKGRKEILKSFLTTIKKNGKIVILEPNPLNPLFYPFYLFSPTVSWEVEKTFLSSDRWTVVKMMQELGLKNIKVVPYGFLPSFLMNKISLVKPTNAIINKSPGLNYFSSFNFFIGEKFN